MASIKKEMKTIFCKVQYNKIDHPEYAKRLTKLYERVSLSQVMFLFEYFNFAPFLIAYNIF